VDDRPRRHDGQVPGRRIRRLDLRRLSRVALERRDRAAPNVDGEYLSQLWNADIEIVRRTKSGAGRDDIYNNKIVAERSYMQAANTRIVTFEMCGNDGLQARSSFSGRAAPATTAARTRRSATARRISQPRCVHQRQRVRRAPS
jgi:hypothetical protein